MCIWFGWPPPQPCFVGYKVTSVHIIPEPLLANPIHHFFTWLLVIFSLLHHSYFKALLIMVGQSVYKDTFCPLGHMDLLPSRVSLIFIEGPMVIQTKTLLSAQAAQTVADLQNPSTPPQALLSHWQDQWEHHLGLHSLDDYPLSHMVMLGILQISLGSIIGAHMEEQWWGNNLRTGQALATSLRWARP